MYSVVLSRFNKKSIIPCTVFCDTNHTTTQTRRYTQDLCTKDSIVKQLEHRTLISYNNFQKNNFEIFTPFSSEIMEGDNSACLYRKLSRGLSNVHKILRELDKECHKIDPNTSFFSYAVMLEKLGIYGDYIRILYNACGANLPQLMATLQANRLDLIPNEVIYYAILSTNRIEGDKMIKLIQEKLPNFNKSIPSEKE